MAEPGWISLGILEGRTSVQDGIWEGLICIMNVGFDQVFNCISRLMGMMMMIRISVGFDWD